MRISGLLNGIAVVGLGVPGIGLAQEFTFTQPASVLVMPYDVTASKASFQIVSRIGASFDGGAALQTHWVYYAADCRHLADVFIFLTEHDTVVVDPTHLRGQLQGTNPPENEPVGPVIDLSGERGMVTVTAATPGNADPRQLVGGWVIANVTTSAAFGADAIGLPFPGVVPDPAVLTDAGLVVPSFDPATLDESRVIVIGVEVDGAEIVPIAHPSAALDGAHVCCDVSFTDNLETGFSLPSFCFDCVGFAAIASNVANPGDTPLVPPTTAATSGGFVTLRNCRSGNFDGSTGNVGEGDFEQFLFAFHGQALGPFGAAVAAKYADEPAI
jgi:hypothetical protein